MSNLKINSNQFIGSHELKRLVQFIKDDGYVDLYRTGIAEYGVVNTPDDELFLNLKVEQGSSFNKINIRSGVAIDTDLNVINVANIIYDGFTIPDDDTWYYVIINYAQRIHEVGTVSIDVDGNLVGEDTKFTEVLRGDPYHNTKVRFSNALSNTLEYTVLEVVSDTQAKLKGTTFTNEEDLLMVVVGTFSPGIVPPNSHKDIYAYDSYEVRYDTDPTLVAGYEFVLARVKNNAGEISIEDLRGDNSFRFNIPRSLPIDSLINNLVGVEKITWGGTYDTEGNHLVTVGWGFRCDDEEWTANALENSITLSGGLGGIYTSISDVQVDDFNDWVVNFPDGTRSKIISTTRVINTIVLELRTSPSSVDGAITITPDARFIEIISRDEGTGLTVNNRSFLFSILEAFGKVDIRYVEDGVKLQYRLIKGDSTTELYDLNDGDYLAEDNFDADGFTKAVPGQTLQVTSSVLQFVKSPDNWREYKAWIHKPNRYTAIQKENFGQTINNATGVIDIGDDGNAFYVDVVNSEVRGIMTKGVGTRVTLIFDGGVTIKDAPLTADELAAGFRPILLISVSAISVPPEESVELIETSGGWKVISLPAVSQLPPIAPPIGGIMMYSGSYAANFDITGLGLPDTDMTGWALCNGNNGTPDLRGRFVVGTLDMPSDGADDLAAEVDPVNGNTNYGMGNTGGEEKHELTIPEMPEHNHLNNEDFNVVLTADNTGTISGPDNIDDEPKLTEYDTIVSQGDGEPHENRPPYYALAYIMRIA